MSNSTDDAVLDYFALLLADDVSDSREVNEASNKQVTNESDKLTSFVDLSTSSPQVKPALTQPKTTATVAFASQKVNKKSLAQLLAPVAEAHRIDIETQLATAQAEIKVSPKIFAHNAATEPKVQLSTQPKTKLAEDVAPIATKKPSVVAPQIKEKLEISASIKLDSQQDKEIQQVVVPQTQTGATPPGITESLIDTLDEQFQVLFFKVAGLTLAVPLVSLGGIVKIERVNHIMGRPNWYHGVQAHRGSQLNVVDTCAWVMPEKYDDKLAQSVNYQYIVLLENSNWGLACESLVNSVKILKSEVNWRTKAGKRPWLAGVVKEQMCGILHVQALIELLNLGLSSQDSID